MNISIRMYFVIFLISAFAGALLVAYQATAAPAQLLLYLSLCSQSLWASLPFNENHIVAFDGWHYYSKELIGDWASMHPAAYHQMIVTGIKAAFGGGIAGFGVLFGLLYALHDDTQVRHLRGRYLSAIKEVNAIARRLYGSGSAKLAKLRLSIQLLMLGQLVVGATGMGKTTAIMAALDFALEQNHRVILTDQNGALTAHYMHNNNFLLLNPFHQWTEDWSPFAEIQHVSDIPNIAKSIIPDAIGAEAAQWTMYSQQKLSAVMERMYLSGNATNGELLRYFRPEARGELKSLLAGKSISALFAPGNERLNANVDGVIVMYLQPYEYLAPNAGVNSFPIRRWVQNGHGWLVFPYLESQLVALRPLIATQLDIASSAVTTLPVIEYPAPAWMVWKPKPLTSCTFLVIDEAANFGRIQSLEDSITKGRKTGLCPVIGLQSVAQLRERYGDNRAETILGSLGSAVIFGTQDPDTAEYLSKRIGDEEVEITTTSSSHNTGVGGDSHIGKSTHQTTRRVVLPAQIAALPRLTAYVALTGVSAVCKIKLKARKLLQHIPSFIQKANLPSCSAQKAETVVQVTDTDQQSSDGPEFV